MIAKHLLPLLVLPLTAFGFSQDLTTLLPEGTFLAMGTQNLAASADKFSDFSKEFQKIGGLEALSTLGQEAAAESKGQQGPKQKAQASDLTPEEKELLKSLGSLDIWGQEVWFGLSASTYSPIPAFTLIAKVNDKGAQTLTKVLADAPKNQRQNLQESGVPFTQLSVNTDSPITEVAYSLHKDLFIFSTNPEELRGTLRRYSGSDEPNFATNALYSDTLGSLTPGNFYSYLDMAKIAEVAAPYGQNMGFDPLVKRLSESFTTAGALASSSAITDEGMSSESLQFVNRNGGDVALYRLLTSPTAISQNIPVPSDAISYSAAAFNASGWYEYLNDIARAVPELGGDLDSFVMSMTGISLRDSIFSWTGNELATISTSLGAATQPGKANENLLGDSVYLIQTKNDAAATRGIDNLLSNLGMMASAMNDPQGQGGQGSFNKKQESIAGTNVTRLNLAPGANLYYTVKDGYLLLATGKKSLESTLTAQADGGVDNAFGDAPATATALAYSNNRALFDELSSQIEEQFKTAAGLSGSKDLNFKETEEVAKKAGDFLKFLGGRMSTTTSYSEVEDNVIKSYSTAAIDWQQ